MIRSCGAYTVQLHDMRIDFLSYSNSPAHRISKSAPELNEAPMLSLMIVQRMIQTPHDLD